MVLKHMFVSFIIVLNTAISFSSSVNKLKCKNIDDNSVHIFEIHKNYKIVNILPNGYEFDYILEEENNRKITGYFYQKKKDFIKKFVLTFNLDKNILYDEMYEGNNFNNLNLKDKKIFTCNNDK